MLDFVEWLNYYYFVLLDAFPLCLHFLTSLIKFARWDCKRPSRAQFFYKQETCRGHGGICPRKASWVLLDYNPHVLILLNLEGEQVWDKRGNNILNRVVNHKLCRATQF